MTHWADHATSTCRQQSRPKRCRRPIRAYVTALQVAGGLRNLAIEPTAWKRCLRTLRASRLGGGSTEAKDNATLNAHRTYRVIYHVGDTLSLQTKGLEGRGHTHGNPPGGAGANPQGLVPNRDQRTTPPAGPQRRAGIGFRSNCSGLPRLSHRLRHALGVRLSLAVKGAHIGTPRFWSAPAFADQTCRY